MRRWARGFSRRARGIRSRAPENPANCGPPIPAASAHGGKCRPTRNRCWGCALLPWARRVPARHRGGRDRRNGQAVALRARPKPSPLVAKSSSDRPKTSPGRPKRTPDRPEGSRVSRNPLPSIRSGLRNGREPLRTIGNSLRTARSALRTSGSLLPRPRSRAAPSGEGSGPAVKISGRAGKSLRSVGRSLRSARRSLPKAAGAVRPLPEPKFFSTFLTWDPKTVVFSEGHDIQGGSRSKRRGRTAISPLPGRRKERG